MPERKFTCPHCGKVITDENIHSYLASKGGAKNSVAQQEARSRAGKNLLTVFPPEKRSEAARRRWEKYREDVAAGRIIPKSKAKVKKPVSPDEKILDYKYRDGSLTLQDLTVFGHYDDIVIGAVKELALLAYGKDEHEACAPSALYNGIIKVREHDGKKYVVYDVPGENALGIDCETHGIIDKELLTVLLSKE